MGVTRLALQGDQGGDENRFEFSLGAGFKLHFTPQVGLRVDVKRHWTALDEDRDCDHCHDDGSSLGTTQVSAGLLFAF